MATEEGCRIRYPQPLRAEAFNRPSPQHISAVDNAASFCDRLISVAVENGPQSVCSIQ